MTSIRASFIAGIIAGSSAFCLGASPALAQSPDVVCVQHQLADRGFEPGPADGLMGTRTRNAAEIYSAIVPNDLPTLATDTAGEWCSSLIAAAEERIGFRLTEEELPEVIFGRTHTYSETEIVVVIGPRGFALRTVPGQEPVSDRVYTVANDTMCVTATNVADAPPDCVHLHRRGPNEFIAIGPTGEVGEPFTVEEIDSSTDRPPGPA